MKSVVESAKSGLESAGSRADSMPIQRKSVCGAHRPIVRGWAAESAIESADSNAELADSTTVSVIIG